MRHHRLSAFILLALSLASPAKADTTRELTEDLGEAFRQLFKEMQPHLEDALEMLEGFEGLNAIDDPRHYRMPEILPNGDIIIRRREDAPVFRRETPESPESGGDETIDL